MIITKVLETITHCKSDNSITNQSVVSDMSIVAYDYEAFENYHNFTSCTILPFITSIGMVGNLISIAILSRKPFRTNVLFAYLQCLSFMDFMYLLVTLVSVLTGHFVR